MIPFIRAWFFLFSAALLATAARGAEPTPAPAPAPAKPAFPGPPAPLSDTAPNILIFGDSLTDGNTLGGNSRQLVWVGVAQKEAGDALNLINEGKGGRQTNSVGQFDKVIAGYRHLEGLAIMLGTNDSRDVSGQCVPKAVGFITQMVEHARAAYGQKLPILLIAPPNVRKDALVASQPIANEREANLKALETAYRELAEKMGLHFATVYDAVPYEALKNDGVHPNPAGNVVLAAALLPELKKLVSK